MRKGFKFISPEDRKTPVFDRVSKTVPDQSLSLREMLLQFSYMSGEKVSEIVNRGFVGDEDDEDVIGVDASALDFTEIHDRLIERINKASLVREPQLKNEPVTEPEPQSSDADAPEDDPQDPNADA